MKYLNIMIYKHRESMNRFFQIYINVSRDGGSFFFCNQIEKQWSLWFLKIIDCLKISILKVYNLQIAAKNKKTYFSITSWHFS